jgi:DNA-binding NtrC family response regulator
MKEEFRMKTKDILLVDDDISYLHLLSMLLKSEGFTVSASSGGINALETLRHDRFKMMITDFNMPEINGVELAAKVKEQRSDMRIVLVTAGNLSEIEEAAADAGISALFNKPIEIQRFLAFIRSSLLAGQNLRA